jgi:8-oxo-dGTP pyrophosphatase MutT (NUDIX family)
MNTHLDQLNSIIKPMRAPYIRPKDAATLIVIDRSGAIPKILMGQRHKNSAFMPGKYVFPGGRVNASDSRAPALQDLLPATCDKLMCNMKGKASPRRARALLMAAIRETYEETGLALGAPHEGKITSRSPDWSDYFKTGIAPKLDHFLFAARAITPPGRPRRFDARFFIADAGELTAHSPALTSGDGELLDIAWLGFDEAMAKDIPLITRIILQEIQDRLRDSNGWSPDFPVPFYYYKSNRFYRELL